MKLINGTPEFFGRTNGQTQIGVDHNDAWANYSKYALVTPEGSTAQEYRDRLTACVSCTYPRFMVENGIVIEENRHSIGD